jgi:integrase
MDKRGCIVAKRRRGQGEGSVYQRADGYWVASVEAGRYPNGKRRRARIVRRTKKAVLAELDDLKRRGAAGLVGRDPTVGEFVDWWIDNVAAPKVADSSLIAYRARYRSWIKPKAIAGRQLRKLQATDVQQWLNDLAAQGIGAASRNSARVLLSSALHYAHGVGMVDRNVVSFVAGSKAPRRDDALTTEEADAVLQAARGDRLEALWVLALKYGMRPTELMAFRWPDVDLDAGKLTVAKAQSGDTGIRDLPLLAGTLEALKAHRQRQLAERLDAGPLWQDTGHVFTRPGGLPTYHKLLNNSWHALLAKAKVADRRPYATRHTAATLLLEADVPLEVVSAILGHSGISITADVYAKVRGDLKRRGLAKLDGG